MQQTDQLRLAAMIMIGHFGLKADAAAALNAARLAANGDREGQAIWSAIAEAIDAVWHRDFVAAARH